MNLNPTLLIVSSLIIASIIEIVTMSLRLVYHLKSKEVQKQINIPRIHHGYVGAIVLLIYYFYLHIGWIAMIGWALLISDVIHHSITLPVFKKRGYDISMRNHKIAHTYFKHILGPILVVTGLLALVTPLTPGSWLVFPGFILILGKERSNFLIKKIVGKKLYEKFRKSPISAKFNQT
ncbi:MAG TPA: hypothetical protein VJH71_02105 [Candidatus Paceibacterota bacterium]